MTRANVYIIEQDGKFKILLGSYTSAGWVAAVKPALEDVL